MLRCDDAGIPRKLQYTHLGPDDSSFEYAYIRQPAPAPRLAIQFETRLSFVWNE